MSIVKGTCACDLLFQTFNIHMFNCGKGNSAAIKHVHNENVDIIESYAVNFDINGWLNLTEMIKVISMEGMVSNAQLCYAQAYLMMRGKCSLIKPAVMKNTNCIICL